MEDKIIETITYIKSVCKKKPSIDRIKTHLLKIGDESMWSIENLPNLLSDMCNKGLIELVDNSYKIKQTRERKLVEETLAKLTNQCASFSESETLVFPESQKFPKSLFLRKSVSTPELPSGQPPTPKKPVKHPGDKCTHNLVLFQNLLKKMEEIKRFTKSNERKFEKLEMALQNISEKNNVNDSNNENSPLLLEILKNRISNLDQELIEKDAIINFLLKQENEANNNTSSVNKTVTENDEILENERGNSCPSSNSKQKIETQTEPSSKKKKTVLTEDSMVNDISEKSLSVNHKVKIVNFPGGTSEKILEKLDVILKEKPGDLIVHVGTNDITNNVNLLTNVKKSSKKFLKRCHRHLSHFHLPLNEKTRRTSRKP